MHIHNCIYICLRVVSMVMRMLKPYNVRLDIKDIKVLDKLEGCRSAHIRHAIQSYLQPDTQNIYNVDLVTILQDRIKDLQSDKRYLQQQNNALMLSRTPLLQRIILRLQS